MVVLAVLIDAVDDAVVNVGSVTGEEGREVTFKAASVEERSENKCVES